MSDFGLCDDKVALAADHGHWPRIARRVSADLPALDSGCGTLADAPDGLLRRDGLREAVWGRTAARRGPARVDRKARRETWHRDEQAAYRPLGALRFLLALMVVIQHAQYIGAHRNLPFFLQMGFGIVAVVVFFVISGFIVGEANAMFYAGRPARFLTNRVLRLVPGYLAALILSVGVHDWLFEVGKLKPWDYTLTGAPLQPRLLLAGAMDILPFFHPNYIGSQDFSFVPFAWSLRIEFLFYALAAAAYSGIMLSASPRRRRCLAAMLFGGLYAAFAIYVASGKAGPQQTDAIPFFLFGIALFMVWQKRTAWRLIHAGLSLGCVFVALALWNQRGHPEFLSQAPVLAVLLAMLGLLVFARRRAGGWARAAWIGWDKRLGELSYPLYINHFSVLLPLSNLFAQRSVAMQAGGVLLSVAVAAVMVVLVERPLRGVRDRVRGRAL